MSEWKQKEAQFESLVYGLRSEREKYLQHEAQSNMVRFLFVDYH